MHELSSEQDLKEVEKSLEGIELHVRYSRLHYSIYTLY